MGYLKGRPGSPNITGPPTDKEAYDRHKKNWRRVFGKTPPEQPVGKTVYVMRNGVMVDKDTLEE